MEEEDLRQEGEEEGLHQEEEEEGLPRGWWKETSTRRRKETWSSTATC